MCTVLGLPVPKLGASSRSSSFTAPTGDPLTTPEAIASLDKYEKALLSSVVRPKDVGVTFDMVGGLAEVKESLRRCVSYPLKYPQLYQVRC